MLMVPCLAADATQHARVEHERLAILHVCQPGREVASTHLKRVVAFKSGHSRRGSQHGLPLQAREWRATRRQGRTDLIDEKVLTRADFHAA